MLGGEGVLERRVARCQQREAERGRGGGDQQDHAQHDRLHLVPQQAAGGGPDRPEPAHRDTPAGTPAIRPSTIRTVRAAYRSASSGSWVTSTSVCPSWFSSRSSRPISCPVAVSSAPVGSSASSTSGEFTSARAIATRCRWPPEIRAG